MGFATSVKRIKLQDDEVEAFESLKNLNATLHMLSGLIGLTERRAWDIIKKNYGDPNDCNSPYFGARYEHKTKELVCPCWKEKE